MDLQKIIEEKTAELIGSGEIEKIISSQIKKTVESLITETINTYADFGKSLKEKISKSLNVDLDKITFPEYQGIMFSYIKDELDKVMITEAKEKIQKQIAKYFKPLDKNVFKLSELIRSFKDSISEIYEECTIIVEKSDSTGYFHIYLDKSEDTGKYSCEYKININDTGIWSLEIDGSNMEKYKGHAIFDFDRLLYQIYTAGAKVEIDQIDFDQYTRDDYC